MQVCKDGGRLGSLFTTPAAWLQTPFPFPLPGPTAAAPCTARLHQCVRVTARKLDAQLDTVPHGLAITRSFTRRAPLKLRAAPAAYPRGARG